MAIHKGNYSIWDNPSKNGCIPWVNKEGDIIETKIGTHWQQKNAQQDQPRGLKNIESTWEIKCKKWFDSLNIVDESCRIDKELKI